VYAGGGEKRMTQGDLAIRSGRPPNPGLFRLTNWEVFFPPGMRVVALPSWKRPRLLLPATSLVERASASGFYPAFRVSGRLYHCLLRVKALLAVGVRSSAADTTPFLAEFVEDVFPKARVRAVQIGMKGFAQKCTLQLAGESGEVIGYVKCAESASPLARQRLRNEFHLLSRLPFGVGPVPIKFGSVGPYDALLLSVVRGKPLRPIIPLPEHVRDFSASLLGADCCSFESHPWVEAHVSQSDQMRRLSEALTGRKWPEAIQHGDFGPWNLIKSVESGLTAIDWEYGAQSGFPGLDLAQYVLQVTGLIRRWQPARARQYAISQLMSEKHLDLTRTEATALVRISAYQSYQNTAMEGHAPTDWAQVWRRGVWEEAI
jgi:hypothetical protein